MIPALEKPERRHRRRRPHVPRRHTPRGSEYLHSGRQDATSPREDERGSGPQPGSCLPREQERTAPRLSPRLASGRVAPYGGTGEPAASPIPQSVTATKILINLEGPASVERCSVLPADGVAFSEPNSSSPATSASPHLPRPDETGNPLRGQARRRHSRRRSGFLQDLCSCASATSGPTTSASSGAVRTWNPLNPIPCSAGGGVRYVSPITKQGFRLECRAVKKVRDHSASPISPYHTLCPDPPGNGAGQGHPRVRGACLRPSFKVWLMVEVPSVDCRPTGSLPLATASPSEARLTQLILAWTGTRAARRHGLLRRTAPLSPGGISMTVRAARKAGIPCSICGEGPSVFPDFAEKTRRHGHGQHQRQPRRPDYTRRSSPRRSRKSSSTANGAGCRGENCHSAERSRSRKFALACHLTACFSADREASPKGEDLAFAVI